MAEVLHSVSLAIDYVTNKHAHSVLCLSTSCHCVPLMLLEVDNKR